MFSYSWLLWAAIKHVPAHTCSGKQGAVREVWSWWGHSKSTCNNKTSFLRGRQLAIYMLGRIITKCGLISLLFAFLGWSGLVFFWLLGGLFAFFILLSFTRLSLLIKAEHTSLASVWHDVVLLSNTRHHNQVKRGFHKRKASNSKCDMTIFIDSN